MADQKMLSWFGGGDLDNVDLEIDDSDGYDFEGRRRVREYAEDVATGGWELAHVGDEKIWWEHPNPSSAKLYRIEKKSGEWSGYRTDRPVDPSRTEDLQEALDGAGEWMAANPIRDVVDEVDDD